MFTCDFSYQFRDSIVASIPACHAGDRGSIPRRGEFCTMWVQDVGIPFASFSPSMPLHGILFLPPPTTTTSKHLIIYAILSS